MAQFTKLIEDWPEESREAAQLVIDKYGEPSEATDSLLIWHEVGPWKRMVAYKEYDQHEFPVPHIDSVESFIAYDVPVSKFSALAAFDGSVKANRTAGELSAKCHDEEANFLALNLAHEIVIGYKDVGEARKHYVEEFIAIRKGEAAPYMKELLFASEGGGDTDKRAIPEEMLEKAGRSNKN